MKEQMPIAEMSMKNEMNAAHSAELRHMIANLAHDLKTVFYFAYIITLIK
jgi:hypothetical protein